MDFEYLKQYKELYIVGHKNPDTDSWISAKTLSEIFQSFRINAIWTAFFDDSLDVCSAKIIPDCTQEKPLLLDRRNIADKKFFLVDHNDVSQSVLDKALVVGCIDHHSDSGNFQDPILSDYCCTALFIYAQFKEVYDFSPQQKKQIFMAFLDDSSFGKSSRYKPKDEEVAETLGCGNDYETLFLKYFVPTDLSGDLQATFATSGIKDYNFPLVSFVGGVIESVGADKLSEYKAFVTGYDGNFLGLWVDYKSVKSYVYFKNKGEVTSTQYDCVASRAATVIPDILKRLQAEG